MADKSNPILKKYKGNKTLMQFWIKNILLAAAVFICFLPVFIIADKNAETVVEKGQEVLLADVHKDAANKMKLLQQKAFYIATNQSVVGLSRERPEDTGEYMLNLYRYRIKLPKEDIFDNTFASHIMVVFPENDILLLNSTVFPRKQDAYGVYFGLEGVSYDDWLDNLYHPYEENRYVHTMVRTSGEGEPFEAITINYYFPSRYLPKIIVSAIIPKEEFMAALLTPELSRYGNIEVKYSFMDNELILCEGGGGQPRSQIKIGGGDGLTITADLTDGFFAASSYIKTTRIKVIAIMCLAWAASFVISYVLARGSLRPLKDIFSLIDSQKLAAGNYTGDAHEYIRNTITELGIERKRLNEDFLSMRSAHEQSVLAMLIRGVQVSPDDLSEVMPRIGALSENTVFIGIKTVSLRAAADDEIRLRERDMICEILNRTLNKPYFLFDDLLYIITSNERDGSVEDIRRSVSQCVRDISQELGLNIAFGICEAHGTENLGMVRGQVMWELDLQRITMATADDTGKIGNYSSRLAELLDVSKDIMASLLIRGSEEQIRSYFGRLNGRITAMDPPVLSIYVKAIYYRIISIFYSVALSGTPRGEHVVFPPYNDMLTLRGNIENLTSIAVSLAQIIRMDDAGAQDNTDFRILEYLRGNYSAPSLCLSMLAEHFKISERSLYSVIKDTTGKSYQEYVDSLRMNEAARLLKDTDISVNSIAARVGYSSGNTFHKAFKRLMGCAPGKYRETLRSGNAENNAPYADTRDE